MVGRFGVVAFEMGELTKNKIKWIQSLSRKKERDEQGLFYAEGAKLVDDLLPYFDCVSLVATSEYFENRKNVRAVEIFEVSKDTLKKVSSQSTPQSVLAVFRKKNSEIRYDELKGKLFLMLDTIQDPGNLGTIIRESDWFGIENVICSKETVDVYNPKVVQATMGALTRVKVCYADLVDVLEKMSGVPVYGTFLEGTNIYEEKLTENGVIVMGNEGNGISEEVAKHVTSKLHIPNFPKGRATSESLNVGAAAAIVCSEFRRRLLVK